MTHTPLVLLGGAHVHLPDHLERIAESGSRIAHVHDRDAERRDRLCADLGARPLAALQDVAQTGAAGAVVCSETSHHEADISAALAAGLPVFSEKPLAGSGGAALRLAQQAEESGVLLHTGYFFRTIPALRKARGWIRDGRLGRITAARMRFAHDGGYADWLDLDCWMTDPTLACYGGFVDEAVHAIDALQWMLGAAVDGHAVTANALGWPVDDHGSAVLRFCNGATGVVEAGWTDARMRLELDIVGETAAISLHDGQMALTPRSADSAAERHDLAKLDAGTGILPYLAALHGTERAGLVPPADAARVNTLLDRLGLRLN
ncbi:Gfo/Idh/MocA family protein [Stappia stellulata]|uniref:Gfo/Idh/MocA family protein n=1 Tax=Stappia stellulata TaxID=71235 RepID=UPI0004908F8A|nr:Gfo/Idh/MocA family oxidoreductase [Stappia stellulata]